MSGLDMEMPPRRPVAKAVSTEGGGGGGGKVKKSVNRYVVGEGEEEEGRGELAFRFLYPFLLFS